MPDETRPPFPFIVGCDRSGTTLLRAMMASHPNMAIPDESYFIVTMARRRRRYERREAFATGRFLRELSHDLNYRRWTISHELVDRELRDHQPTNFADAIRGVYKMYAHERGKSRYGDKTPFYVGYLDTLAELFDEAVFVHIVRDGRAVALSMVEHEAQLAKDVGEAAAFWRERVRSGRSVGQSLGSRYLELRYEDLVSDPRASLAAVCLHVQLPFDEEIFEHMLSYSRQADTLLADALHRSMHTRITNAVMTTLRDWRRDMSPRDRALFEAIAGDALEELGYELSSTAAERLTERRDAICAQVRWFVRSRLFLAWLVAADWYRSTVRA